MSAGDDQGAAADRPEAERPVREPRAPVARPGVPRAALDGAGEIEKIFTPARQLAAELDEARVQRSFRNWLDWIAARRGAETVTLALMLGGDLKTVAPDLARSVPAEGVVELSAKGGDDQDGHPPWPQLVHDSVPEGVRLVLIGGKANLAEDWSSCGCLRRDCLALVRSEAVPEVAVPRSLLADLPLGVVTLSLQEGAALAMEASGRLADRSFRLVAPADLGLAGLIAAVVPTAVVPSLRAAQTAQDLAMAARVLQAAQASAARSADSGFLTEQARAARSEEARLIVEQDLISLARSEAAGELKSVQTTLRFARSELDASELLGAEPPASFALLMSKLEVDSSVLPADVVDQRRKRDWWHGTRFAVFGGMLNKKFEIQVKPQALREALQDVHRAALKAVGAQAVTHISAHNAVVENLALTFPGAAPILAAHKVDKVHPDNFVLSERIPPGGRRPDSELSQQIKAAAEKAFAAFAETEARSFKIERDRKGFIGQVTEARTAVFGLYFLLLMGARRIKGPNADIVMDVLANILMGMIVVGFFVNLIAAPRQERALLAERVESKLEELRTRLAAFVERFVKDQLGLLETLLADKAAVLDADLARALATVKARLELPRTAAQPGRPTDSAPLRPRDLEAEATALAARLKLAFRDEYLAMARR